MTVFSFSESDDESPRMKKSKDLAADEDAKHGLALQTENDFSCTCGRKYDSASGILTHWWMIEDEDREWETLHRAIERKSDSTE